MDKIVIWHNTRCRKSREGLAMVEKVAQEKSLKVEIRKYLDQPPSESELKEVLNMMNKKPIDLVRKKEQIWKDQFKGEELSDEEIIKAMVQYPKLIERPIVLYNGKAVLAQPAEEVLKLFN